LYRLVDSKYWSLRRQEQPLWKFDEVAKLRRKMLRTLNRCRKPGYQLSLRERIY
jgi:hypothetical protein